MDQHITRKWIISDWLIIILLFIIKLAIHLFTNTNYNLHRDEYLYLAFADHLDYGYFSNAPLIGILACITQFLFGSSVFAIRLLPAIIGAVTVILVGVMVKELGGKSGRSYWPVHP